MSKLHYLDVASEGFLDHVLVGAVDQHRHCLCHEGIADVLAFERDHAVFTGYSRELYQLHDQVFWLLELILKRFSSNF